MPIDAARSGFEAKTRTRPPTFAGRLDDPMNVHGRGVRRFGTGPNPTARVEWETVFFATADNQNPSEDSVYLSGRGLG